MTKDLPPPELLRKLLRYEPETGKLFWRERTPEMFTATEKRSAEHKCSNWNSRWSEKEALTADNGSGYLCGNIFGRLYRAHRVIWAMRTGAWPVNDIDHIDGDKAFNAIENLREATRSENMSNRMLQENSTSGFKGVTWDKSLQKWMAQIQKSGKNHYLGRFTCPKAAHAAYCKAAKELHGKYANTGA